MVDVGALVGLCLFYLFSRSQGKNIVTLCLLLFLLPLLHNPAFADRSALIDIQNERGNSAPKSSTGDLKIKGSYSKAGSVKNAEGPIHQLPDECGENDDADLSNRPHGDWIALLHYPPRFATNDSECQSVLDRVRKAMLFGASAIIILALNPRIIKELDIAQIFSHPVVLVQEVENVTAILGAIANQIGIRVKLAYNTSFYDLQKISTLTLWATCGRSSGVDSYNEWEGVVCLGKQGVSKADPSQLWSYFFSSLFMILLLLVIKAKRGPHDNAMDQIEDSVRLLAGQALSLMKCQPYAGHMSDRCNDRCAICLDYFHIKQSIRELPCQHEFHSDCIDPWLIKQRTCPLCKRNILDFFKDHSFD